MSTQRSKKRTYLMDFMDFYNMKKCKVMNLVYLMIRSVFI